MTSPSDLVRVHVDFNDMDMDGRFYVLPDDVVGQLKLQSHVMLHDAEGNSARGTVIELMGQGRAMIEMITGSWHRGEVPTPAAAARAVQDQVLGLLASYLPSPGSLSGLFRWSGTVSSGFVPQTAALPSGRPQPQGAVLSSL